MHTITHNGAPIPVTGEEADRAIKSSLLQSWIATVDPAFHIEHITIQSVDVKSRNGWIIFIKMKVTAKFPDGSPHDMVVILRDQAVAALCILRCQGKRYGVIVQQPRLPIGTFIYESPAGMVDDGTSPESVIVRELEEEAQLVTLLGITDKDVHRLLPADRKLFSSPGAFSEKTTPFYLEVEVQKEQLDRLHNLKAGLASEHEDITVHIVPYESIAEYCNDSKTLAMLYLYENRNSV